MKFKAVLFDLDGVLIDSEPLNVKTEQEVCRQHGIVVPQEQWDGRFQGRPNRDIFRHLVDNFAQEPIEIETLIQEKRKLYLELAATEIKPIPGAFEVLARAKEKLGRVALVTGSSRPVVRRILEIFPIAQFFNTVVTPEDVVNGKPAPDSYALACKRLRKYSGHCVVIEDSLNGIMAGYRSGCTTIGLATSLPGSALHAGGAHYIAQNHADVARILEL